jgi:flagellar biosynthesis/type III secretory pathway protein FliH
MGRIIKTSTNRSKPKRLGKEAEKAQADLIATIAAASQIRVQAKKDVINLSLEIAKKVIGKAISLDPSYLDSIYTGALSAAGNLESARLHVHPADRAVSNIDTLAKSHAIEIVDDPEVGRAGCRIAFHGAELDATLETALNTLGAALRGYGSD